MGRMYLNSMIEAVKLLVGSVMADKTVAKYL